MFEREVHRTVLAVLTSLDPMAFRRFGALFAGGTRIALDHGEFRESRDIDFLCSDAERYADLRVAIGESGYRALFDETGRTGVELPREIRADQYGVRFPVVVNGRTVRVEIVREARFEMAPGVLPAWSPVECIAIGDCFTSKLLANCDRWADRDTLFRDLLDLAVLRQAHGSIPAASWRAAEMAYKSAVRSDLSKALRAFLDDREARLRCFSGLAVPDERQDPILEAMRTLRREI